MNKESLIKILDSQFNINDTEKTDILYRLLKNQETIDKESGNEKGFLLEVINTFVNNIVFDLVNIDTLDKDDNTIEYKIAAALTHNQLKSLEQYNIDGIAQVMSVVTYETVYTITKAILNDLMELGNKNSSNLKLNEIVNGGDSLSKAHKILIDRVGNVVKNFKEDDLFLITNVQLGVVLQNISGFKEEKMDNKISQFSANVYKLGEIVLEDKNVNVYIDPNMNWSDTKILIGEKTEDFILKLYTIFNPKIEVSGTSAPKYANKVKVLIEKNEDTKSFSVINVDLGENILI